MTTTPPASKLPVHFNTWVTAGFIYIYLAWGATYMGVHCALESLPPFLLMSTRFLLAGSALLALLWLFQRRDFHWGTLREWREAGTVGIMLLVGGNGGLVWAQQYVTTSLAALIFGSMPLCIILFDWIRPGGTAPSSRTCIGLAMGFAGLCVLFQPSADHTTSQMEFAGKLALVFAACSWSAGAIYSRHVHATGSPFLPMGRQMIVGGLGLLLASFVHHDWDHFSLAQVTMKSWLGFGYLVIFGSLIGFTVYIWLMRVCSPERASTITYINIVVAMIIGTTFGREPLTLRLFLGAAVIVGAVVLVLKKKTTQTVVNEAPPEA